MESRESSLYSSAGASATNRETAATGASGGGEEDAVPSVTTTLAKDAALHFQAGRFDECLEVLHQLALKKEDDPKILHNIAISEYFRDECSNPKKLLEALKTVKRKSEELASVSKEMIENSSNVGSKAFSGAKGNIALSGVPSSDSNSLVYMDEFYSTVASLNIGIVWYHLHDYAKALSVLEPLYQSIEPIDEGIALHVCLLLLNVTLAFQEASKSADVLIYLEKAFGVGCMSQTENGSAAPANSSVKSFTVAANSSISDPGTDLSNSGISLDNSLSRSLSLSDDVLDYDESMFSLEMGGQNLVRTAGLPSCDFARNPLNKLQSSIDLKLKLQLYKVQFLLLTRNLKQAKREVKLAMNIARGRDSSTALLLKSQLEYARGNHRKAIKLLMASANRSEDGMASMLNNLGCIYYQLGKYHLSSFMFSKALASYSSLRKEKSAKRFVFAEDKSIFIVHNSGLQYLLCGKPLLAARCFKNAITVFYNRPISWLRLADCCLIALEKGLLKVEKHSSELSDIFVHVIGKGKYRYLSINNGESENADECSAKQADNTTLLSLRMARHFLWNGLHLLEASESKAANFDLPSVLSFDDHESAEGPHKHAKQKGFSSLDAKAASSANQHSSNGDSKEPKWTSCQEIIQNSLLCYEETRVKENLKIKQALLANLAYVQLELGNPQKALYRANSLLQLDGCSKIYRYIGHVYAAEALCLLKKPDEASSLLSAYLSERSDVMLPFSEDDREQWRADKGVDNEEQNGTVLLEEDAQGISFQTPEEAHGTLYANFAVVEAMQGNLERAHVFVARALDLLPNSRGAMLTAVYVDLMLGKTQAAIDKLKVCKRVKFVPCSV